MCLLRYMKYLNYLGFWLSKSNREDFHYTFFYKSVVHKNMRLWISKTQYGGAYEVLDYRIIVDFFENYRNTVIKYLYKYRHRSIFYQKLCFTVTARWLNYRIPSIFYSNYRNTAQKIGKYRIPSYRTPPPIYDNFIILSYLVLNLRSKLISNNPGPPFPSRPNVWKMSR